MKSSRVRQNQSLFSRPRRIGNGKLLFPKSLSFLNYGAAHGASKADYGTNMRGELINQNPILYEGHIVHSTDESVWNRFFEALFCHALLLIF
jgi:hypothetical protein